MLGKHTDYAGGRSLLAAVDRGFRVTVRRADEPCITVADTGRRETLAIPLSAADGPDRDPPSAGPDPEPDWAVYPRTVVRRAARDAPGRLAGCRIELQSDLPPAAGLGSSSALVTAIYLALDAVCDLRPEALRCPEALAEYLAAVERGSPYPLGPGEHPDPAEAHPGVGTRGGSGDHVALLCAGSGRLVRYAFEPVRKEGAVAVPGGHVFIVAASGVIAEKTGAARHRYNRLSDEARRAAAVWRGATGEADAHLGAIIADVGEATLAGVIRRHAKPAERDRLLDRVRHFAAESTEIVPAAFDALGANDLEAFGALADRSQALAGALLRNQVPETTHLAGTARALGAPAASAFGAGFGGSVWALVPAADADAFARRWRDDYLDAFPARSDTATFLTTPAADPAPLP